MLNETTIIKVISELLGGLAVGVPGEVKGLHLAHKKYGKLEWGELIQPTIDLAENGYPMTLRMYEAAETMKTTIEKDPGMRYVEKSISVKKILCFIKR